ESVKHITFTYKRESLADSLMRRLPRSTRTTRLRATRTSRNLRRNAVAAHFPIRAFGRPGKHLPFGPARGFKNTGCGRRALRGACVSDGMKYRGRWSCALGRVV